MKKEHPYDTELSHAIKKSLSQIEVPASIYAFAKELPAFAETDRRHEGLRRKQRRRFKNLWFSAASKSAAAGVILAGAVAAGVYASPAFAAYMKDIPGFSIAVEWLFQLRSQDGVQNAMDHGYSPIEPKTVQWGGTTVTIGDIYLTDEELLFKTFIRTDEFDVTDPRPVTRYEIKPKNLLGGGSTTGQSVVESSDGKKEPVLQLSYKYQLMENEVRRFLSSGQKELLFEVTKLTRHPEGKKVEIEQAGVIAIPFDASKLLHNKTVEPRQKLAVSANEADLREVTLEKLTIQPTTMNVILSGFHDLEVEFPREGDGAPYLKDEKGNIYRYDPSGPGLMLEEGMMQLPFMSSVFFDPEIRTLSLHIGEIRVTGRKPSGSFELALKDSFPKTVSFLGRDITILSARHHEEGYLHLEIAKEHPEQQVLRGVAFDMEEYKEELRADEKLRRQVDELRVALQIDGFGIASGRGNAALDLYIPAPKRDRYVISLYRWMDVVQVDKDFTVFIFE